MSLMLIITVKPPSLLAPFPLLKMNWKELSLHSSNLQAILPITDNTFSGVGDLVISFSFTALSCLTHMNQLENFDSLPLSLLSYHSSCTSARLSRPHFSLQHQPQKPAACIRPVSHLQTHYLPSVSDLCLSISGSQRLFIYIVILHYQVLSFKLQCSSPSSLLQQHCCHPIPSHYLPIRLPEQPCSQMDYTY